MRRRVKEQLKKMGGLEYWDTSFSYIDRDLGQETFVPVPEMGGGSLIVEGSLAPGGVYSIGTDMTQWKDANAKNKLFVWFEICLPRLSGLHGGARERHFPGK
jgi:hypothetical protein